MLRHSGRRDDLSTVRRDNIRLLTKPRGFAMSHSRPRRCASSLCVLCCIVLLVGAPIVSSADFGAGFKAKRAAVDGGTVSVTVQVSHSKETKR
jgi:hypothetical protein